jgi:hypothetical protein
VSESRRSRWLRRLVGHGRRSHPSWGLTMAVRRDGINGGHFHLFSETRIKISMHLMLGKLRYTWNWRVVEMISTWRDQDERNARLLARWGNSCNLQQSTASRLCPQRHRLRHHTILCFTGRRSLLIASAWCHSCTALQRQDKSLPSEMVVYSFYIFDRHGKSLHIASADGC